MRDLDFDHFGPWVREVSDDDPPSPLFVPYLTRQEAPLLSVKIPRKIEIHRARPGMDLYDFLVSLYERDLVILQRSGEGVTKHSFPYRDIQFLRYREELLKGMVNLGLTGGFFDLPFNTVSSKVMQRLVALIRERYCPAPQQAPALAEASGLPEGLSYYFTGLILKKDIIDPQFDLLAAQVNTPIACSEQGRLGSLFYTVAGKTLLESLHWSDGRELKIVTRGQDYKYKWQSNYAREYTYLPLENIRGFHWQDDARHKAAAQLIIETPAGPLSYLFTIANPYIPAYARFLAAAATPYSASTAVPQP